MLAKEILPALKNALNSSHIDLNKLDLSYFTDGNYNKYSNESLMLDQSVGSARNSKINDPNTYQNRINDGDMLFQFVDNYDNLVNDPSISASQKSIIKELYWEIGILTGNIEAGITYFTNDAYYKDNDDPITGESITNDELPDNALDIFKGYKVSSLSHLDSALICASENYTDTGTSCH